MDDKLRKSVETSERFLAEMLSFTAIAAGLFLNVDLPTGLAGTALHLLQALLLMAVFTLLAGILVIRCSKLMEEIAAFIDQEDIEGKYVRRKTVAALSILFLVLALVVFVLTTFIYTVFGFVREVQYVGTVFAAFLTAYLIISKSRSTKGKHLVVKSLVITYRVFAVTLLLIVVPSIGYYWLYRPDQVYAAMSAVLQLIPY